MEDFLEEVALKRRQSGSMSLAGGREGRGTACANPRGHRKLAVFGKLKGALCGAFGWRGRKRGGAGSDPNLSGTREPEHEGGFYSKSNGKTLEQLYCFILSCIKISV